MKTSSTAITKRVEFRTESERDNAYNQLNALLEKDKSLYGESYSGIVHRDIGLITKITDPKIEIYKISYPEHPSKNKWELDVKFDFVENNTANDCVSQLIPRWVSINYLPAKYITIDVALKEESQRRYRVSYIQFLNNQKLKGFVLQANDIINRIGCIYGELITSVGFNRMNPFINQRNISIRTVSVKADYENLQAAIEYELLGACRNCPENSVFISPRYAIREPVQILCALDFGVDMMENHESCSEDVEDVLKDFIKSDD